MKSADGRNDPLLFAISPVTQSHRRARTHHWGNYSEPRIAAFGLQISRQGLTARALVTPAECSLDPLISTAVSNTSDRKPSRPSRFVESPYFVTVSADPCELARAAGRGLHAARDRLLMTGTQPPSELLNDLS